MSNRNRIIKIALELFASRGYDAVGVQEIADNSGITKPTLYHYFKSKRGLLEMIIKEYASDLIINVTKASNYSGNLEKSLNDTAGEYFGYAALNPDFFRLKLSLWLAPPASEPFKVILPYIQLEQKAVEDLFMRASADNEQLKGRHSSHALSFLGIIHTYIGISFNGYAKLNESLKEKAVHQFMYGLFS